MSRDARDDRLTSFNARFYTADDVALTVVHPRLAPAEPLRRGADDQQRV